MDDVEDALNVLIAEAGMANASPLTATASTVPSLWHIKINVSRENPTRLFCSTAPAV